MIDETKLSDYFVERTVLGKCIREVEVDEKYNLIKVRAEWVPAIWAVSDTRLEDYPFEELLSEVFTTRINETFWKSFLESYRIAMLDNVPKEEMMKYYVDEIKAQTSIECWDMLKSTTFWDVKNIERHLKEEFNIEGYDILFTIMNNVSFHDDFFEVLYNDCARFGFKGGNKFVSLTETHSSDSDIETILNRMTELLVKKSETAVERFFVKYGSVDDLSNIFQ